MTTEAFGRTTHALRPQNADSTQRGTMIQAIHQVSRKLQILLLTW